METSMIKRSNRFDILQTLEENPEWNIVDLGSGEDGSCEHATTFVDLNDWKIKPENKDLIIHDLNNLPLPFKDKEFDFCWASHILEHVKDPISFIKEVVRISDRGYIEVPTPLIDNLVSGDDIHDPNGHKWWVYYDDSNEKIVVRPRKNLLYKTVDIPELNRLYPFFRSSFVVELYWEKDINIEIGDEIYSYEGKTYDLSKNVPPISILGESRLRVQK